MDPEPPPTDDRRESALIEALEPGLREGDTTAELVAESLGTSAPRAGGLIRSGILVSFAVIAANALNAAFQFVMARVLDPAEFSLLATMFTVVLMITVPLAGLQVMMAREVSARMPEGGLPAAGAAFKQAIRQVGGWIVLIVLGTAILAYPLIELLNIQRPLPFLATASVLAVGLPLPLAFGVLQGMERFGVLSLIQPVYALVKLIAGLAIGLAGFGASAIMFGITGATVASMVVAMIPLRAVLKAADDAPAEGRKLTLINAFSAGTAIGVCGYAVHTSVDVLVARIAFDATMAGQWAAAAAVAKTILLVPTGITTVLFPRVAKLRDRGAERSHMLFGLAAVTVVGGVVAVLYWIFADTIISIAFGSAYAPAADWLGPLSLAMLIYALVGVYLFHYLSIGTIRYAITVAWLVLGQLVMFLLLHRTPADLIIVQGAAALILVLAGEYYQRRGPGPVVDGF